MSTTVYCIQCPNGNCKGIYQSQQEANNTCNILNQNKKQLVYFEENLSVVVDQIKQSSQLLYTILSHLGIDTTSVVLSEQQAYSVHSKTLL